MIFQNKRWDLRVELSLTTPLYLHINNPSDIYQFLQDYHNTIENENDNVTLYNNAFLKLDVSSDYITDLISLDLNNRKTLNFLYKELSNHIVMHNFEAINDIKNKINKLLTKTRQSSLIDFSFTDELEVVNLLKLFTIKYSKRNNSLYELLIKYLELLTEISKTQVVFLNFAFFLFTKEEINDLITFCEQNNLYLIFIEKNEPCYNNIVKVINIIDNELL